MSNFIRHPLTTVITGGFKILLRAVDYQRDRLINKTTVTDDLQQQINTLRQEIIELKQQQSS